MVKRWKRGIQSLYIIVSTFGLMACGTDSSQAESKLYYTTEYTSLNTTTNGYSHCLTVDGIWYVADAEVFEICYSDTEGTLDYEIRLSSGEIPLSLAFCEEKQELFCLIRTDIDETQASYMLRGYDTEGAKQWERNIELNNNVMINQMLVTVSGQIYMTSGQEVYAINADGDSYISYPATGEGIAVIAMDEAEDIYVVQSRNGGYEILRLNQQDKEMESISNVRNGFIPVLSHGQGLYFSNGNSLLQYEDGWQDILSFGEQAIDCSHVQEILCIGENQYRVLSYDDTQGGEWELASLKGQEREMNEETELTEKISLSIATVVKGRNAYTEAIYTFNRNYPEYWLNQKEYADDTEGASSRQQQIQASLLSNDPPDLLEVYSMADYEKYVDKGYLEPLTPYLEKSDRVDLEDFLPSVVEEFTRNGQIYALPTTFTVSTLACSQSLLGEQTTWTIEEFLDFLEEHPNAYLAEPNSNLEPEELTKGRLLGIILDRGVEGFINQETGDIKLDSERFRNVMDRVKDLSMTDRNMENESEEVTIWMINIYQAGAVRDLECENHEEMVLIGYPTAEKGDGNTLLSPSQPLAILSSSKEKEGAWLFIEGQLASEYTYRGFNLPCRVSQLEKKLEYEWENYREIPEGYTMSEDAAAHYLITERHMNMTKEAIENAVIRSDSWLQVRWIIQEEAEYYFNGVKSLDEVIEIMQSRTQLYLNERQ